MGYIPADRAAGAQVLQFPDMLLLNLWPQVWQQWKHSRSGGAWTGLIFTPRPPFSQWLPGEVVGQPAHYRNTAPHQCEFH